MDHLFQDPVKSALMEEAPSVSGRRCRVEASCLGVEAACLGRRVLEGNRRRVEPLDQRTTGRGWRIDITL